MRVLITGPDGFVGKSLCKRMLAEGEFEIVQVNRRLTGAITGETDWKAHLRGVDAVVHLAARVHVLQETSANPKREFQITNRDATVQLAEQAAAFGVKKFIFFSTIGVHGNETATGEVFSECSPIRTHNSYTQSKWEAEERLESLRKSTRMNILVIRPPLIYGSDPVGNFRTLVGIVKKRVPLPLASVRNRRTLLFQGNLDDFVVRCLKGADSQVRNETFVLADRESVSTPELIRLIGNAMGRKARLFLFPVAALRAAAKLVGREKQFSQLAGSLVVDSSKAQKVLAWTPPYSLEEGLRMSLDQAASSSPKSSAH